MFSTGETSHGCGHALRTVYNGLRTTGADFVTNRYHRDNINIVVNTTVDKVTFEKDGSFIRATGVELISNDGQRRSVRARREVIISGGTYCSPAILLRSGIGPKEQLAQHGIETILDRPGVGQNLLDHLVSDSF